MDLVKPDIAGIVHSDPRYIGILQAGRGASRGADRRCYKEIPEMGGSGAILANRICRTFAVPDIARGIDGHHMGMGRANRMLFDFNVSGCRWSETPQHRIAVLSKPDGMCCS